MKKILIITGDLATGKSTFGEILANRYCCTALYKDRVKEILAEKVGFSDREENKRLSVAAVELMIHCFTSMASSGVDLILEANFKEEELQKISELAKKRGYETLTLILRADMNIIYKRFVNRIENENRHPAHVSGFDGYDSLKYYIEVGRSQAAFGDVLEINANDFSYQTDERILSHIDDFWGKDYEGN